MTKAEQMLLSIAFLACCMPYVLCQGSADNQKCEIAVNWSMEFEAIPNSPEMAEKEAGYLRSIVGPEKLVVMEESSNYPIDHLGFANSSYDEALDTTFRMLKIQTGSDGSDLGVWGPWWEFNNQFPPFDAATGHIVPVAENSPQTFAAIFNVYAERYKSYFPKGRIALPLDISTQVSAGDYNRRFLDDYLENIYWRNVDVIIFQRFLWLNPNNVDNSDLDPSLVRPVLHNDTVLKTKPVWFAIGVPRGTYAQEGGKMVLKASIDDAKQLECLKGFIDEIALMKKEYGWELVVVNVFFENKAESEGVDYSLGPNGAKLASEFVCYAAANNITVSFFDPDKELPRTFKCDYPCAA